MNCACCGAEFTSETMFNGECYACFRELNNDEATDASIHRQAQLARGAPPTTSGLSDEQQARVEAARNR